MKQKAAALIGGALAVSLFVLIFAAPSMTLGTPKVTIEEIIDLPDGVASNNSSPSKVVTGSVKYDMTLNFDDGSKKTFSENVSIGSLPLQSISAGGKKVKTIDADAWATINLPQGLDESVTKTVYIESSPNLFLSGNKIGGQSFNTHYNFDRLSAPVQLYHLSIPADNINLTSGNYTLTLSSTEKIRFVVNGENRIMNVQASPTFAFSNDAGVLKEIYSISYSPAGAAVLDRVPIYVERMGCAVTTENPTGICKELSSYETFIRIKAEGFKPSTQVNFKYEDKSLTPDTLTRSVLLQKGQTNLITDLTGKATDTTKVGGYQLSEPKCYQYYAHFTITDGENTAKGKAGCSLRESRGNAEGPGYYQ